MRIIAGKLGGRIFKSPSGHRTHPMSDKVRGALFAALGDIEGLSVLDGFSGSGALAFEAISRGASSVVAIEIDTNAHKTITQSIEELGIKGHAKAIRANVSAWSTRHQLEQFDLVLCDPPYDNLQHKVLRRISKHVRDGGMLVLSWPGSQKPPTLEPLQIIQTKNYGDIALHYYKKVVQ